jgi:hypothetical protein
MIIGFIVSPHPKGLSSLCPFWLTHDADYHRLLHVFHASAWQLEPLIAHWSGLVLNQHVAVVVAGRYFLLGDHTAVLKDARRMPGLVTLHQHSETQSKSMQFSDRGCPSVSKSVKGFCSTWARLPGMPA